ncbi:MAG: hypothetical protein RRY36_07775 [Bacteroidaceae bacterium]
MKKTFIYNDEEISIESTHRYGQYVLRGLGTSIHCTDAQIYDWCDDGDEDESQQEEARARAYRILKTNSFEER